jgi:guanylate kinase|nr:MAG TPA: Guanylate kinase [Caudoviricetes sp.]
MIYVLLGKTASGKDTIASKLAKKGLKRVVTYTTRPPRKGEKDGENYHFITNDEFEGLIQSGFFAEWRSYDTVDGVWYYGSSIDSYDTDEDRIIILNPDGFHQIKKILEPEKVKSIYVYSNIKTIRNRLKKRGDKKEEAERRIEHDLIDFKGLENEVDKIMYNNEDDNLDDVVQKILSYITENK